MRLSLRFHTALLLTALLITTLTSPAALQNACDLDSVDAYLDRGSEHYNNEEYQQAAADYTCALELDTQDITALTMRGNSYVELEQYADAIADYNRALEFETGVNAYLYHNIALAYYLQDDRVNAESYLEQSFEADSSYAPSYALRGNFAYERGDYTDAMADYEEAIRLNYDSVWIPYYNHGLAQYELGSYEESVEDFDAAIQANPEDALSYLARAGTLDILEPENALRDYIRWIELIEESSESETVEAPVEDLALTMTEGQVYRYDFRGASGQNLSAAARVSDDSELDPLLVLLDPSGQPIEADDDSGVNLDAVIPTFTLPETGLYTLVISHAGGGTDGTLSLSLVFDSEVGREFSIYELRVNDPVQIYTTTGDNLNLRSGPGLDFDITARLPKDSEATLLVDHHRKDQG
jgi:tetratricopeptide (TPR) repeat protein